MKKYLLVEPNFPIPAKSKNHHNFLPIGLLKLASYLRENGNKVKLVRGEADSYRLVAIKRFKPTEIWITSLFTYWARHVKVVVQYYKGVFPKATIVVGGIYASLIDKKEVKKYTGCDKVYQGVHPKAEEYEPAYDLIENNNPHPVDYQIIHASRGCKRRCSFCGTWQIEPAFIAKDTIEGEIIYRKIVFYDNNFLMNPNVEDILEELIKLKQKKEILWCESQSGFDGRLLINNKKLGSMLKQAGFRYPRIAWDGPYSEHQNISKQINTLTQAGYSAENIYVFMIYNWDIPCNEMEKKRIKCWEWRVQISDCRFRPLTQLFDNYKPRKVGQTNEDYYIHEEAGWDDDLVKQFRKNVRSQNICVRQGVDIYSRDLELKKVSPTKVKKLKKMKSRRMKINFMKKNEISYWIPEQATYRINN
ncbi:MAG: cobalamin B12-binding domain-containing protein [Desulfobacteraceae bacterium]|uniref:Cobalamin B12-binding domain-containing protein n=1 Tax=Candidatus Desulfaltia bathyphila TaxID=2841697 RepID=A0A8J6TC61_9BACT|nr:cobalamin B12-binding domain-containing protein [Candidatus Desulfaltia bathyphila]